MRRKARSRHTTSAGVWARKNARSPARLSGIKTTSAVSGIGSKAQGRTCAGAQPFVVFVSSGTREG